jgi:DNA polymerase-3 subunit beta
VLTLSVAGEDEGRARERLDVRYSGEPMTVGLNTGYLLDGLAALRADVVRLSFTTPTKPILLSGVGDGSTRPSFSYMIAPRRLAG